MTAKWVFFIKHEGSKMDLFVVALGVRIQRSPVALVVGVISYLIESKVNVWDIRWLGCRWARLISHFFHGRTFHWAHSSGNVSYGCTRRYVLVDGTWNRLSPNRRRSSAPLQSDVVSSSPAETPHGSDTHRVHLSYCHGRSNTLITPPRRCLRRSRYERRCNKAVEMWSGR